MLQKKHDVLELATIPRDRGQLQHLINQARANRRRARLMYSVAVLAFVAALIVLFVWFSGRTSTTGAPPSATLQQAVYLPLAIR